MSYLLKVCLVGLALGAGMIPFVAAQPLAKSPAAQELQAGISVRLPATRHALPMHDADQPGSMSVSVTRNGNLYVGTNPAGPAELVECLKARRSEEKFYIKADARNRYGSVKKILDAIRSAGIESTVLLTGQRVTPKPGTPVPPYGLMVTLGPLLRNGSRAAVVQLLDTGEGRPQLKINDEFIPWGNLQNTLTRGLKSRTKKVVVVKAAKSLPYADVVHVADVCYSIGARVILATQGP